SRGYRHSLFLRRLLHEPIRSRGRFHHSRRNGRCSPAAAFSGNLREALRSNHLKKRGIAPKVSIFKTYGSTAIPGIVGKKIAAYFCLAVGLAGLALPLLPGIPLLIVGLALLGPEHQIRRMLSRWKLWRTGKRS